MIRSKIIKLAEKELGYVEEKSNKTKYGKWFGLDGQPWCGMFVSWIYHHAGASLGNIGLKKGFAGCQTAVAHFKKTGEMTSFPEPGDIVFFDWNDDKRYDHVGIYIKHLPNNNFESIEGNTSFANQSNGGQVMLRERQYKNCLFVSPKILTL